MSIEMVGTGESHPFVIPLTKIDVERRLVIGTAAEEILDKSKEIMDYATARPQFESWSAGYSDATGGLSKGNVRVMHTKQVAGRLDDISFDDASKKVQIVAKISDANEWAKVLDGAYTGFSIGGGYLSKWKDPETGATRYTPIVREISLVDNPCMPTARFAELVKGHGLPVEQLELRGVARSFADLWAARPVEPKTFGELAKGLFGPSKKDVAAAAAGAASRAERDAHEEQSRQAVDPAAYATAFLNRFGGRRLAAHKELHTAITANYQDYKAKKTDLSGLLGRNTRHLSEAQHAQRVAAGKQSHKRRGALKKADTAVSPPTFAELMKLKPQA